MRLNTLAPDKIFSDGSTALGNTAASYWRKNWKQFVCELGGNNTDRGNTSVSGYANQDLWSVKQREQ